MAGPEDDGGAVEGPTVVRSDLARERTELAWSRSGLAVTVTVAVILRRLWPLSGGKAVTALAIIAVGAVIWLVGMQLGRRARRNADSVLAASTCKTLTVGTLVLAAVAFAISFF